MFKHLPVVTRNLIIINIALFLLTTILSSAGIIELDVLLGSYYPESVNFKFWQPFTHIFIHAGISHLLFNMFALFMFGATIEHLIGTKRFLILYFVAGMGSFLLFNVQSYFMIEPLKDAVFNLGLAPEQINALIKLDNFGNATVPAFFNTVTEVSALVQAYITPMVGASGAIYGILIAFGMFYPNAELMFFFIPKPVKAKYFIPGIILIEIVLGLLNLSWNPIAHFAHLGGAAAGFLLILYWRKSGQISR